MKKLILNLLSFVLLPAPLCFAQLVRVPVPFPSISNQYSPLLQANIAPNLPVIAVCNSPANGTPCTNYATTYTSLGVACSNGAQDTPDPQPSDCQATGDAEGNLGFWVNPGTYDYTVCIENTVTCLGPYTITATGGAGSLLLQTNGTNNGSQSKLNLHSSDSSIILTDDGSGNTNVQAATQSAPLPFMFGPGLFDVTSSTAAIEGTNSLVLVRKFSITQPITIGHATWTTTSGTSSVTYAFGIYSSSGSKLVDTGVQTQRNGTFSASFTQVTLQPGTYWMAATQAAGNSLSFVSFPVNEHLILNTVTVKVGLSANASVSGVLPATLGVITALPSDEFGIPCVAWEP
ncbi:MAG TPA: hypothetical protein VGG46_04110 [Terriglobales bacterium]|jgi:hypothetical protein